MARKPKPTRPVEAPATPAEPELLMLGEAPAPVRRGRPPKSTQTPLPSSAAEDDSVAAADAAGVADAGADAPDTPSKKRQGPQAEGVGRRGGFLVPATSLGASRGSGAASPGMPGPQRSRRMLFRRLRLWTRTDWPLAATPTPGTLPKARRPTRQRPLPPCRGQLRRRGRRNGTEPRTRCSSTGPRSSGPRRRTAPTRPWPSCWSLHAQRAPTRAGRFDVEHLRLRRQAQAVVRILCGMTL